MNKISVALIEDHHLTRAGIKAALEDCEELEFIGEAANGLQGITLLEKTRPDVAIVDIGLPGLVDGIELTKRFKEYVQTSKAPSVDNQPKVLILTALLNTGMNSRFPNCYKPSMMSFVTSEKS